MQHNYNNKRISEKTVSVIIPVYQVSQYLNQCLDSVLSQTLEGMEIILIDDGSSDESAEICDEYALKDSRVIVVHKHNGGQSSARNVGLEIFTCPYLVFLDSDDYLANDDVYKKIYDIQIENNCDIAFFKYIIFKENEPIEDLEPESEIEISDILSHEDIMDLFFKTLNRTYQIIVWNKMYRKDIFKNVRFEQGNMAEDLRIVPYILKECDSGVCIETKAVCYRLRPDSVSHTANAKLYADNVYSWAKTYEVAKEEKTPQINVAIECFERNFYLWYYAAWRSPKVKTNNPKDEKKRKQLLRRMRKDFRFIFPSLIKPSYQKNIKKLICACFFLISPYLFLIYNRIFKAVNV